MVAGAFFSISADPIAHPCHGSGAVAGGQCSGQPGTDVLAA
jgi:hypothetical protein